MEDNGDTIEGGEETSGVDAPSEGEQGDQTSGFDFDEQPSEATQWAQEAEQEGDDSGQNPDEDLGDLGGDEQPEDAD
jgi:hypothetical protein